MISALCWVPKGAAKGVLEQAELTEQEAAAMEQEAAALGDGENEHEGEEDEELSSSGDEGQEAEQGLDEAAQVLRARAVAKALKAGGRRKDGASSSGAGGLEDAMAELDMEAYDEDDDAVNVFGSGTPGLSYYRDPQGDPYITLKDEGTDSEAEDMAIRPDDLVILAARNDDDVSHLEVWVYEEAGEEGVPNLYVHHDLLLPAFPLAVAWLDCDVSGRCEFANLAAVGSFSPEVEVWDLDVADAVEPVAVLGGELKAAEGETMKKKQKKKSAKSKKAKVYKEGSHTDAVLGLAWNREYRNVLASASADSTVKVWDLSTQQCSQTLQHHSSKVQAVAWNPAQASILLSGGFDQKAYAVDLRTADAAPLQWAVSADVEALAWNPHEPTTFVVSSEDGIVAAFDARGGSGGAPLFRLGAHDKPACALSFCPAAPGLLATASTDKQVKLWDISSAAPTLIASQDPQVGAVFTAAFCPESPFSIAAGGSKGKVAVWDTLSNAAVAAKCGRLARKVQRAAGQQAAAEQAADE